MVRTTKYEEWKTAVKEIYFTSLEHDPSGTTTKFGCMAYICKAVKNKYDYDAIPNPYVEGDWLEAKDFIYMGERLNCWEWHDLICKMTILIFP